MYIFVIFVSLCFAVPYRPSHGETIRDLQDSHGDELCPDDRPTFARDIQNLIVQQCLSPRAIIPMAGKIRNVLVYENRRLSVYGHSFKTFIYDSFKEKWADVPNFRCINQKLELRITPYTRGKLYALNSSSYWFLIKFYGEDSVRPTESTLLSTAVGSTVSSTASITTVMESTLSSTTSSTVKTSSSTKTTEGTLLSTTVGSTVSSTTSIITVMESTLSRTTSSTVKTSSSTKTTNTLPSSANATVTTIASRAQIPASNDSGAAIAGLVSVGLFLLICGCIVYRRLILPRRVLPNPSESAETISLDSIPSDIRIDYF